MRPRLVPGFRATVRHPEQRLDAERIAETVDAASAQTVDDPVVWATAAEVATLTRRLSGKIRRGQ